MSSSREPGAAARRLQSTDLDDEEDEVSSTSSPPCSPSCSPSPARYDKFKPMPYVYNPRKIEKLEKDQSPGIIREDIDIYKLCGSDDGEVGLTIFNEKRSLWEDFEIFGEISITDGQNNTFYIYKCEEDDPESVSTERNSLFLKDCPITPVYTGGKVKFSITDKKSGQMFFEGDFDVDFSINDAYANNKQTLKCFGKHGFYALMKYTKIPFALVAEVSLFIDDGNEDGATNVDIYGTIKMNDLVLFEEKSSEPVTLKHGKWNCLELSTHVLAVPIYSRLACEVKLHSGDSEFADGKFEIFPNDLHPVLFSRYCNDESCSLLVDVTWFFYKEYFTRGNERLVDNVDVKWNLIRSPWVQWKDRDPPSDEKLKPALVEVFSVFVGGESRTPLGLCGKIVVRDLDRNQMVFIFARNSKIPDVLTDEQWRTVSLAWPDRWFVEKDFYIFLNLKDEYGNKVCRGNIDLYRDPVITESSQHDRRFCDVIQGEDGYFAAVHYSVFKNGKKAKVSVIWTGGYGTVVYGSVYAAYSGSTYKYPSTYDQKYYRSIIFERSRKDGETVEKDCEIPLSKSHVSAPSDCKGLCLDVNLYYEKPCRNNYFNPSGFKLYSHTFTFSADGKEVRRPDGKKVRRRPFRLNVEGVASNEFRVISAKWLPWVVSDEYEIHSCFRDFTPPWQQSCACRGL